MEGDRGAVLTVRSAVRGVIDYSEVDLFEKSWWRRWRVLVTGMSSLDTTELLKPLFDYQLALVANSGLTEDSFKKAQESARDNFETIVGAMRPWEGRNKEERLSGDIDQYKKDWQEIFGWDLDDEEQLTEYWEKRNKAEARLGLEAEQATQEEEDRARRFREAQERVKQRRSLTSKR